MPVDELVAVWLLPVAFVDMVTFEDPVAFKDWGAAVDATATSARVVIYNVLLTLMYARISTDCEVPGDVHSAVKLVLEELDRREPLLQELPPDAPLHTPKFIVVLESTA